MDAFFKQGVVSIILSIWAFTAPIISIVKNRNEIVNATCGVRVTEEPGLHHVEDNSANVICCPCISVCVLVNHMVEWDITRTLMIRQNTVQRERTGLELQNLSPNPDLERSLESLGSSNSHFSSLRTLYLVSKEKLVSIVVRVIKGIVGFIAMPSLVNYFIEANGDQTKIARVFLLGAPIFQDWGIGVLSLLNYSTFSLFLSFNSFRSADYVNRKFFTFLYACWSLGVVITSYYYASKLEDPIEKLFLVTIMTIRTFGAPEMSCQLACIGTNCCGINLVKFFFAGINLWYAVQNVIWALRGTNVLDPSVSLWRPF